MENVTQAMDHSPAYDYSYYYNDESVQDFLVCEKPHVQAFTKIFLPLTYAVVITLGLAGNGLLIFFLIRYAKLKSTVGVLLLQMAVSDTLFILTLPFWAVYAQSEWVFGLLGCKAVTVIYTANLYSSILFVTCLSLNAYLLVVRASNALHTPSRRAMMCVVVWTLSLLASVPGLLFVTVEDFRGQKLCVASFGEGTVSHQKLFMKLQLIVCGFLLPFLAMAFFYLRIACVMVKSGTRRRSKVVKLAILLVMVFFVLWFPYNLVLVLHCLQDLHVISNCTLSRNLDLAVQVTESLAFLHACINPVLYAFVDKRLRSRVAKALKKLCLRGREYSLECTGSTSSILVPNPGIELQAMQPKDG